MKVVHVLKSNIYSGAEHVVITMIKNMGVEYECIYISPDGPITDRLEKEGINHYVIPEFNNKCLKKAIEDVKPDIVHAHDFSASVIASSVCKQYKNIKLISHIHNNPLWIKKKIDPRSIAYLWVSKNFEHIIAVSDAVQNEYVYASKLNKKIDVVGNPFDKQEILDRAKDNNKTEQSLQSDILFVGRLATPKGPIQFLEIIAKYVEVYCKENGSLPIVKMVGDGELKEECEKYITEHSLESVVTLEGFQENPYQYMANTKVLVMPSIWEGFGLVALEAMSFGVPVLCSGAGGLKDIVTEECGRICENSNQYTEKLNMMLNDNSYFEKYKEGAMKQSNKYDNVKEYIEQIKVMYED